MSSLKSMLPTDSFSIGNSCSWTGSTLTDWSCEADRSKLAAPPPADPPDDPAGAPCALAFDVGAPSSDLGHMPDGPKKYQPAATSSAVAATAAPAVIALFSGAIDRPEHAPGRAL